LAVLLPHTAWAFRQFEPDTDWGKGTAIAAAFAFEAAIVVLTHKLAIHIATVKRGKNKFVRRYVNAFSIGLLIAVAVSGLANLAHAVEFGGELSIIEKGPAPFALFVVAFGGILPLCSLLFARVLSNVVETDSDRDRELAAALSTVREHKRSVSEANARADQAEQRFAAAGDLMVALVGGDKRARILAVRRQWPELPVRSVAYVAESSPSYVSEVLKAEGNGRDN
jgi:hypothetical protein